LTKPPATHSTGSRTRRCETSLDSSHGDMPASTFVELPDRVHIAAAQRSN
jgi:hypothetical protein